MNNEDLVVFTVLVHITRDQLANFINVLNRFELRDGEEPLTVDEVISKPNLLKYICDEAVEDGAAIVDPVQFWNEDGWCDWRQFR